MIIFTIIGVIAVLVLIGVGLEQYSKNHKNINTKRPSNEVGVASCVEMCKILIEEGDYIKALSYVDVALSLNPHDTTLKELKFVLNDLSKNKSKREGEEIKKNQIARPELNYAELVIANANKWTEAESELKAESKLKEVIWKFLYPDKIRFEDYIENQKANETIDGFNGGLEAWENLNSISINRKPPIKCTKTFREHFANNRFNRGSQVPDWFYIGYPDVAFWFHQNINEFENEMELKDDEYLDDNGITLMFFRTIIDRYKEKQGKLECGINR